MTPRTLCGLVSAALCASLTLVTTGEGARAAEPGFVTILFGRAQWVQTTPRCQPSEKTVPLDEVARDLTARGLSATVNVVVNRTGETTRTCFGQYTLQSSWADIRSLADDHGWGVISAGQAYVNMKNLTPEQQDAESCGSLQAFTARGHTGAWGMFAYPNNGWTTQIQADVVSRCFAYGRTYRGAVNVKTNLVAPYLHSTVSVNGGQCNDPALPCYTAPVPNNRRYADPTALRAKFASATADRWTTVQFYRLVTGKATAGKFSWDCSATDWRRHTTSNAELYCYSDFLTAIEGIPAGAVVADPATVARAWGRNLPR